MSEKKRQILIIRFSSFGDIVQAMAASAYLKCEHGFERVDWLTKENFSQLVSSGRFVDRVLTIPKGQGLWGLIKQAFHLRKTTNYDYIYDAHSNLRSRVFVFAFLFANFNGPKLIRRSKQRWRRFLLFYLRKNYFPRPFRGMFSFVTPLSKELVNRPFEEGDLTQQLEFLKESQQENLIEQYPILEADFIAIAPAAAWKMKMWPQSHWEAFLSLAKEYQIVVLGGAQDIFCEKFERDFKNVRNLAGKLSLIESSWVVSRARVLISADTGLLHIADLVKTPGLALIGPTAFGFPSHEHIKVLEVPLECRPCTKDGRGRCIQKVYQKCMVDISPEEVFENLNRVY